MKDEFICNSCNNCLIRSHSKDNDELDTLVCLIGTNEVVFQGEGWIPIYKCNRYSSIKDKE